MSNEQRNLINLQTGDDFFAADGDDHVLSALLQILPCEGEAALIAGKRTPPKFVTKLDEIKSNARVKVDAVGDYLSSWLMRSRFRHRGLPTTRVDSLEVNLLNKFHRSVDRRMSDAFQSDVERGKAIYDDCVDYAEQQEVSGFTIDHRVNRGELHRLANGEGKEEISWLPKEGV